MTAIRFVFDGIRYNLSGSRSYVLWMTFLFAVMAFGLFCYRLQWEHGLAVTGMNDHVSWGLYISNFTFLVGLAAAAVMLVLPAYVLKDIDFTKAVLIGEGVAVSALIMCLCFVTVDLGSPERVWHMFPGVGYFNFPNSLLTWDVIVLNGYLALNLLIPAYILFKQYRGKKPNKSIYVPFVYLSVFWAVGIHMVTAFLYAGLPARPFWNSSLLGPRFLASAFAAGPAFIILALSIIKHKAKYPVGNNVIDKLAMIATVAAQANIIMLVSELFKEFYWPTAHSHSAHYLFFGLDGKAGLVPWIWTAIAMNVIATIAMTIHPLRRTPSVLYLSCITLFVAIWIEKGMGLIVPGFIPSPLGEIVEYLPTWPEVGVTAGIWAMGLMIFTVLARVAIAIDLGKLGQKNRPSA